METLLYLLYMAAGRAPMIPLDEALRPTWLFGQTVHEGCDRGGYYEQAEFAEEYGSPLCIVKLGCWGPVVQCNVGKRGWMGGIGGCPNVGGICIGCTMPGFPDKFMPFMNQPPGSLLSSSAVHDLWEGHSRASKVHAGVAQQGAELAAPVDDGAMIRSQHWSNRMALRRVKPNGEAPRSAKRDMERRARSCRMLDEAEAILFELASVFGSSRLHATVRTPAFQRQTPQPRISKRGTGRWWNRFPPSCSWPIWTEASAKPTSVRKSRRRWGSRKRNGWKIRCAGITQIHPDDKQRWSVEAADMFLSGKPLRSAYRVIARDGRVVWFHCEAKMIRRDDGSAVVHPWRGLRHHRSEADRSGALQEERNVVSAILDTVGALVIVLDPRGPHRAVQSRLRATTGYSFDEVQGKHIWDLFLPPEEVERFSAIVAATAGRTCCHSDYESHWLTRTRCAAADRLVQHRAARAATGRRYIIATGIDITERKQLERAILEISEREQRRIGQDLHDGLGQHLTGIAFMSQGAWSRSLRTSGCPRPPTRPKS